MDLFGSFGDALGVLWSWLPSEIMLVLVAGVFLFGILLYCLMRLIRRCLEVMDAMMAYSVGMLDAVAGNPLPLIFL